MASPDSPVEVKPEPVLRKRPRWRLRILLVFGVLSVALFAISRLEPDQARRFGPPIESVYRVFNPPIEVELTDAGKQFIAEITALGGRAGRFPYDYWAALDRPILYAAEAIAKPRELCLGTSIERTESFVEIVHGRLVDRFDFDISDRVYVRLCWDRDSIQS